VNTRVLRTEVRRSIAPWATLAILVVAFGFLYSFSGPWTRTPLAWDEHWVLAAEWSRFLLVFLWPIAIGAGVIQGMRDSRSGMVELLTTMPRPGWHRAAKLAAALGGLLVLGYLLVFAVGAVQVIFNGGFFTFGWLPIVVVGVLAMLAGAWIGLGIGRLLPHPLTAPAVAVAAFVAVIVFQVVPSEGSAFGAGGVHGGTVVLGAGLLVVAAGLLGARGGGRGDRHRPERTGRRPRPVRRDPLVSPSRRASPADRRTRFRGRAPAAAVGAGAGSGRDHRAERGRAARPRRDLGGAVRRCLRVDVAAVLVRGRVLHTAW
jgi:hypothetical protein